MNTEFARVGLNEKEDAAVFARAAGIIRRGGLVAFPTETVYGLGANALDQGAVGKIYSAKGRPSDNPLIAHIASEEGLLACASFVPDKAKSLARNFWPGPLSLILPKNPGIPYITTGGRETVAVRWPGHWAARRLIEAAAVPIAAPSANISGAPSPTKAAHVWNDLNGKIDMIIDGGSCGYGIESTIIDAAAGNLRILRPGSITASMIKSALGAVEISGAAETGAAEAPGMKYGHYAPRAEMTVVDGNINETIEYINGMCLKSGLPKERLGVFAADETAGKYLYARVCAAGSRLNPENIASKIYGALRDFDERGVKYIYSEAFYDTELGLSIMNRLEKAAGYKIVCLNNRRQI